MAQPSESTREGSETAQALELDLSWVRGYLDLIASGVSLDQFLRRIHEEIGYLFKVRYLQIFFYDQEGHLVPTTTFGVAPEQQPHPLAKDDLHPVTDCARTEEILAIPTHVEYVNRYSTLTWGNGPSLFVPLRVGPLVDGVFAMVFERDETIDWSAKSRIQEAIVVMAQLSHLINMRTPHTRDLGPAHSDSDVTLGLSDRQMVIAKMIAQGMTNRNIARELGFSEATIRYETIKLYERLRVKNRSHAAARIHQLGIG